MLTPNFFYADLRSFPEMFYADFHSFLEINIDRNKM